MSIVSEGDIEPSDDSCGSKAIEPMLTACETREGEEWRETMV